MIESEDKRCQSESLPNIDMNNNDDLKEELDNLLAQ